MDSEPYKTLLNIEELKMPYPYKCKGKVIDHDDFGFYVDPESITDERGNRITSKIPRKFYIYKLSKKKARGKSIDIHLTSYTEKVVFGHIWLGDS